MDVTAALDQTFAHASSVIAGVRAAQHGDKTRDEGELEWPMAWLRRHDAYDD